VIYFCLFQTAYHPLDARGQPGNDPPVSIGPGTGGWDLFPWKKWLTAPHRQFRPFGVGDSKQTFIVRLQDLLKVATMTKIRF
jgi:hypothetical protein